MAKAGSGAVYGGNDNISGEGGSDTVIGGVGQDTIYSDNLTASNGGNDGQAVLIGDNARIFYAGTTGQFRQMEAVEIQLVRKSPK